MTEIVNGYAYGTLPRAPVLEWLKTVIAAGTGWPVEVATVPTDPSSGKPVPYPYYVAWSIPGLPADGQGLTFPDGAGFVTFQIDSVADRYDQCVWLSDRVRKAILGRDSAGAHLFDAPTDGVTIVERFGDDSPGPTMIPQGDQPRVWTASERFRLYVTAD